jgi:outer membrane protein OmpA-like peptidoglycan-associated protein
MGTATRKPLDGDGDDKVFWISFADQMTALMVLFLVVMAVALLSITGAKTQEPQKPAAQAVVAAPAPKPAPSAEPDIDQLLKEFKAAVDAVPGVRFDMQRHVIDFGDRARFATASHRLEADSAKLLRDFVPQVLKVASSELGQKWVRRVVVEGFADSRGNYLYNLNLSLQRAQRVMCSLLDVSDEASRLNDAQRSQVRDIFAIGGFSFNDQRDSLDASRRIEMRIEFGPTPTPAAQARKDEAGACQLPA